MPNIKPVSDLRNYDEVLRDIAADLCSEQTAGHKNRPRENTRDEE